MNASILVGICAVISFGAAQASADQDDKSTTSLADTTAPEVVACARQPGVPLEQCSYHIKRDENGRTTVTVVFANGFKRGLFFVDGKFQKASVTMSGVGTDTDWSLKDGTHIIRVDRQRYEVPDTLIVGD